MQAKDGSILPSAEATAKGSLLPPVVASHSQRRADQRRAREIQKNCHRRKRSLVFCVTLPFANLKAFLMNRKLEMLELDDSDGDMRGNMMGMAMGGMSMAAMGMGVGVNHSYQPSQYHHEQHHNALDIMDSAPHEVSGRLLSLEMDRSCLDINLDCAISYFLFY